jgi:ubiquinone/menaquinone biosynthesis C-methylase UbiE
MSVTADPRRLFTERPDRYARFIRAMRYPQGLRAFWVASPLLRPGLRVLDAGCGTGALTLALWDAAARRRIDLGALDGFDLTPAMLDRLRITAARRDLDHIRLTQANVLQLAALPASWRDYDLVVSAAMLEYVPRARFPDALRDCVRD